VFAFCSWLVTLGIFCKVTLSFLLQSHTHEDIDQLFVPISSKYLRSIIWWLQDLINLVPAAYTSADTRPTPIVLPFVHDWKKFFDPVLLPLQGHSGPHVFVFQRDANAKVVMFYKDYHSSIDNLHGGNGDGGLEIISALPTGVPQVVERASLPADSVKIPDLFSMPGFTETAQAEWLKIINGEIPQVLVPEDYFNFEQMRYQNATRNYTIPLPPAGFEITQEGGYQSESSVV
jgi:hypothetical protein